MGKFKIDGDVDVKTGVRELCPRKLDGNVWKIVLLFYVNIKFNKL